MLDPPKTIEEARAYKYQYWRGNPKGTKYREGFCAYEVWGPRVHSWQCHS